MCRCLAAAVLVLALVSAGLGALLTPLGEVPDEAAHLSRADSVVHLQVVGRRGPDVNVRGTLVPDAGVMVNGGLHRALPYFPDGLAPAARGLTRAAVAGFEAQAWDRRPGYVSAANTAPYSPVFYATAAAGLRVAQAAGAGPWQAMLVARLCNAVFYALAGAAALLLARRAHALLAATLLLPMSLYLAGSLNQDGGVIAAAVLAAALLTRPGPGAAWAGAAVLALVVVAKPVYLPLAGLLLLAPLGWRARAGAAALAGVPGAVWFVVARGMAGVSFWVPEAYASGPLWPGPPAMFAVTDPALQVQVLLHQPALLLRLPAEAILLHGAGRMRELVGVLGRLDLFLPAPLYAAWGLALTAAVLAAALGPSLPSGPRWRWSPLWAGACLAASVFAVYISQYLVWTRVGMEEVAGVQGRYFVPLLPFLAFALPQYGLRRGPVLHAIARGLVLAAAALSAVVVPVLTANTYLLR